LRINSHKLIVLERIKKQLLAMLEQATHAKNEAQTEANAHIGAMQSRYDTFKEEAQYLAAAQAIRLLRLENDIAACEHLEKRLRLTPDYKFNVIETGAWFKVIAPSDKKYAQAFFIAPGAGGMLVDMGGIETLCVDSDAPIIKSYIGLLEGDEPELTIQTCPSDAYIEVVA